MQHRPNEEFKRKDPKTRRAPNGSKIICKKALIDWSNLPEGMGDFAMSRAKQASTQKYKRKALPVLGAAGLSLSLASGASAAFSGRAADMQTRNTGVSHEITLGEEEISDVSLATFYVFDKENAGTFRPGIRFAMGAGCAGCSGCAGCGGCWTGTNYTTSIFGNDANPPYHPMKPAHKHTHAPKKP